MSSNELGENLRITTFGESHGPALGVVVDGVRPGIEIDLDAIQHELDRRRPGSNLLTTPRKEADRLEVLSGLFEGKTTGAPIAMIIRNTNARSKDYDAWKDVFRPGHADLTWWKKFGIRDHRGGGRTSGRETASRVAAGALARQLLAGLGVTITGHVRRIGSVVAEQFDRDQIELNDVRCADAQAAQRMAEEIKAARKDGDSVGGIVEVIAEGVPAGWGDPVFQKLDAQLAAALMSIGAVKGVELGDGFALAAKRGSESNDPIAPEGFVSNHMGGVLGGISSGAPVVVRAAVKPTSSIRHEQQTIDTAGQPRTLRVPGRHDPCICPRVVPVAEAMVALVLCDAYLRQQAIEEAKTDPQQLAAELSFCDGEMLRLIYRRRQVVSNGGGARLDEAAKRALQEARGQMSEQLGISAQRAEALFALVEQVAQRETDRRRTQAAARKGMRTKRW